MYLYDLFFSYSNITVKTFLLSFKQDIVPEAECSSD